MVCEYRQANEDDLANMMLLSLRGASSHFTQQTSNSSEQMPVLLMWCHANWICFCPSVFKEAAYCGWSDNCTVLCTEFNNMSPSQHAGFVFCTLLHLILILINILLIFLFGWHSDVVVSTVSRQEVSLFKCVLRLCSASSHSPKPCRLRWG